MARQIKAYSIGKAIAQFLCTVRNLKESAAELKQRISIYANMLLDGDKDTLIICLKCELDYNAYQLTF